ncbi:hypothetical protein E4U17_007056, partial [Claviceps sp. LM77 group G4]
MTWEQRRGRLMQTRKLERCHESRDDAGSKSNGGFGHAPQVKKLLPRPTSPRYGAESDGEL